MKIVRDSITGVNLVALYGNGVTFGLFDISHLATFLDLKDELTELLIVIRTIAYLLCSLYITE